MGTATDHSPHISNELYDKLVSIVTSGEIEIPESLQTEKEILGFVEIELRKAGRVLELAELKTGIKLSGYLSPENSMNIRGDDTIHTISTLPRRIGEAIEVVTKKFSDLVNVLYLERLLKPKKKWTQFQLLPIQPNESTEDSGRRNAMDFRRWVLWINTLSDSNRLSEIDRREFHQGDSLSAARRVRSLQTNSVPI